MGEEPLAPRACRLGERQLLELSRVTQQELWLWGWGTATTKPLPGGKERGVGNKTPVNLLSSDLLSVAAIGECRNVWTQSEEVSLLGAEQGEKGLEWIWGYVPAW